MNFQNQLLKKIHFCLITLLFIAGCSATNHYDKGKEYLSTKHYPEAISEFQQVTADSKDFRLAQSKINYIQGLQAFQDSLFQAAEVQLAKVVSEDEYYHESLLMLDKIMQSRKVTETPRKDTLIIKQEVTGLRENENPGGKIKATEVTDGDATKKFVSQTESLIDKFESLYQTAHTTSVDSKKNYLSNMQSLQNKLGALDYTARERNAEAIELKKKAASWMSKRIEFISRLISDNSIQETNTSRSLKEEGDKMYYGVTQQLKKVK
ncbi:MAG: hypothetical protein ABI543_12390 [Ignavibacteria bacterium]